MRFRLPRLRPFAYVALLIAIPVAAAAQDDSPSLGDLARTIRKNKSQQQAQQQTQQQTQPQPAPSRPIIDNDNLTQVMDDAHKARPVNPQKTVFSIDPSGNTVKVSSPDVTCSLSFK